MFSRLELRRVRPPLAKQSMATTAIDCHGFDLICVCSNLLIFAFAFFQARACRIHRSFEFVYSRQRFCNSSLRSFVLFLSSGLHSQPGAHPASTFCHNLSFDATVTSSRTKNTSFSTTPSPWPEPSKPPANPPEAKPPASR